MDAEKSKHMLMFAIIMKAKIMKTRRVTLRKFGKVKIFWSTAIKLKVNSEKIFKSSSSSGYVFYHSVQNLLLSRLLSKM